MMRMRVNSKPGRIEASELPSVFGSWFLALTLVCLLAGAGTSLAQTITSNGTGGGLWTSASTWSGGTVPDSTNCTMVIIAGSDSVATSQTQLASCNGLDIQSGGKLAVFGPSTSGFGLRVKGAFTIEANSWFYNYYGSLTGWPGNASSYSIDPHSNFVLTGSASSTLGSNTADSLFGNLYIYAPMTFGASVTVQGNLVINPGSNGNYIRGIGLIDARKGVYSLVHHVLGNVYLQSGCLSAVDFDTTAGVMTCVWNIDGNVYVGDTAVGLQRARFGPFSSASTLGNSRIGIFNINGNLSFVSGARLQVGTSSTSPSTAEVGEINLKGNLSLDGTALNTGNSSGTFAMNFVGNKTQTVSLGIPISYSPNSGGYAPTLTDTIASGATVVFAACRPWGGVTKTSTPPANGWGQWVVNGTLMISQSDSIIGTKSFFLNKSATLGIGSREGITAGTAAGDTVGNIIVTGTRSFSAEANYVYDGVDSQVTGNGLPTTVNNLTIADSAGVTLSASDTVAGTLTMTSGKLYLGSNGLFVSNNAPSAVVGSDTSSYVVGSLARAQGTATGAYAFPIGSATGYHGATLDFTAAPSGASNLTMTFTDSDPTSAGLPAGITGYWPTGYWSVTSNGTPGGTYDLSLYAGGVPGVDTGGVVVLQKALLADAWLVAGSGTNVSANVATGKGITGLGIFGLGYGKITGVLSRVNGVPTKMALGNFPNPFNPTTQIQFAVPKNAHVTLQVYNDIGQKVATLVDDNLTAGVYQRVFDGSRYASGMYFARLVIGDHMMTSKMLMLK